MRDDILLRVLRAHEDYGDVYLGEPDELTKALGDGGGFRAHKYIRRVKRMIAGKMRWAYTYAEDLKARRKGVVSEASLGKRRTQTRSAFEHFVDIAKRKLEQIATALASTPKADEDAGKAPASASTDEAGKAGKKKREPSAAHQTARLPTLAQLENRRREIMAALDWLSHNDPDNTSEWETKTAELSALGDRLEAVREQIGAAKVAEPAEVKPEQDTATATDRPLTDAEQRQREEAARKAGEASKGSGIVMPEWTGLASRISAAWRYFAAKCAPEGIWDRKAETITFPSPGSRPISLYEMNETQTRRLMDMGSLENMRGTALLPTSKQSGAGAKAVTRLFNQLGLPPKALSVGSSFYLKLYNEPFLPLTIERHGPLLMLTHYREMNGDLVVDSEVIFKITAEGQLILDQTTAGGPYGPHTSTKPDPGFARMMLDNVLSYGFGEIPAAQWGGDHGPILAALATPPAPHVEDREPTPAGAEPAEPKALEVAPNVFERVLDLETETKINDMMATARKAEKAAKRREARALKTGTPAVPTLKKPTPAEKNAATDAEDVKGRKSLGKIVKVALGAALRKLSPVGRNAPEGKAVTRAVPPEPQAPPDAKASPKVSPEKSKAPRPRKTGDVPVPEPAHGSTRTEGGRMYAWDHASLAWVRVEPIDRGQAHALLLQRLAGTIKAVKNAPQFGGRKGWGMVNREKGNLTATAMARHLIEAGRAPTAGEREILRGYSGWGGASGTGSLTEYYTPPTVVAAMWEALKDLGLRPGHRVLEPGCGSGSFIEQAPEGVRCIGVELGQMALTERPAGELDPAVEIAKVLHEPNGHEIWQSDISDFALTDGREFDFIVGNPPYGKRVNAKASGDKSDTVSLERYSMEMGLDKLADNGYVAMLMPASSMGVSVSGFGAGEGPGAIREWRKRLLTKGQLVAAYRLPTEVFKQGGCAMGADIMIFRAHPRELRERLQGATTTQLTEMGLYDDEFVAGHYFSGRGAANMLGEFSRPPTFDERLAQLEGALKVAETDDERERIAASIANVKVYTEGGKGGNLTGLKQSSSTLCKGDPDAPFGMTPETLATLLDPATRDPQTFADGDVIKKLASGREQLDRITAANKKPYAISKPGDTRHDPATGTKYVLMPDGMWLSRDKLPEVHNLDSEGTSAAVEDAEKIAAVSAALNLAMLEGDRIAALEQQQKLGPMVRQYLEDHGNPHRIKGVKALRKAKGDAERRTFLHMMMLFGKDGSFSEILTREPNAAERSKREIADASSLSSVTEYLADTSRDIRVSDILEKWTGGTGDDEHRGAEVRQWLVASTDYFPEPYPPGAWSHRADFLSGNLIGKAEDLKRARAGMPNQELAAQYDAAIAVLEANTHEMNFDQIRIDMRADWMPDEVLTGYFQHVVRGMGYGENVAAKITIVNDGTITDIHGLDRQNRSEITHQNYEILWTLLRHLNRVPLGSEGQKELMSMHRDHFKDWLAGQDDLRQLVEQTYSSIYGAWTPVAYSNEDPVPKGRNNQTLDEAIVTLEGKIAAQSDPQKKAKLERRLKGTRKRAATEGGKAVNLKLYPFQASSANRAIAEGRGLIALDVGLGKTPIGVTIAAHLAAMGNERTMLPVPKQTLSNWYEEFKVWAPGVDVLMIGLKWDAKKIDKKTGKPGAWVEESADEKAKKLMEVQAGLHQVILCTHDLTNAIRLSENADKRLTQDEILTRRKGAIEELKEKHAKSGSKEDDGVKVTEGDWLRFNATLAGPAPVSEEEAESLLASLEIIAARLSQGDTKKDARRLKAIEEIIRNETARADKLSYGEESEATRGIDWDSLGIRNMIVDEAHAYKNLYTAVDPDQPGSVANMGGRAESIRARQMEKKCRFMREQRGDEKGVFYMTATPCKNSPMELYNLFAQTDPALLRTLGIETPFAFVNRYCQIEDRQGLSLAGEVEMKPTLVGFQNLDELRILMGRAMDRKTASEVGLEVPTVSRVTHEIAMDDDQQAATTAIREYVDTLKHMSRQEAKAQDINVIAELGRCLSKMEGVAMDMDLLAERKGKVENVGEDADENPLTNLPIPKDHWKRSPKYRALAKAASEVYKAGVDVDGTNIKTGQIIFAERTTSHQRIKQHLIEQGIPEDQIAIINAKVTPSSADRQAIADAFRAGDIRIVIGNTATAGEGINLQDWCSDIHHLDQRWEPGSMHQREGRGVRQGNQIGHVRIHDYFAERSAEGIRAQNVRGKATWQEALFSGSEMVDFGDPGMEMEEMLAYFAEDPEAARAALGVAKRAFAKREIEQQQDVADDLWSRVQKSRALIRRTAPSSNAHKSAVQRVEVDERRLARLEHWKHKDLLAVKEPMLWDHDSGVFVREGTMFEVTGSGYYKDPKKVVVDYVEAEQNRATVHFLGSPNHTMTLTLENLRDGSIIVPNEYRPKDTQKYEIHALTLGAASAPYDGKAEIESLLGKPGEDKWWHGALSDLRFVPDAQIAAASDAIQDWEERERRKASVYGERTWVVTNGGKTRVVNSRTELQPNERHVLPTAADRELVFKALQEKVYERSQEAQSGGRDPDSAVRASGKDDPDTRKLLDTLKSYWGETRSAANVYQKWQTEVPHPAEKAFGHPVSLRLALAAAGTRRAAARR